MEDNNFSFSQLNPYVLIDYARDTYDYSKEFLSVLNVNIRTSAYALGVVGAAMIANAVDEIPVIGELTTLIGLLTVVNFLANPDFREDVRGLYLALDRQIFGEREESES